MQRQQELSPTGEVKALAESGKTGTPVAAAPTPRTDMLQLEHTRSCAYWSTDDKDCTCCLHERIHTQTAETLLAAWQKRATEAETELAALNDKYLTVKLAWKLRGDELTRAETALAEANRKMAEFEQDALRYRWVLTKAVITDFIFQFLKSPERHVSNAIDAARKGESHGTE